MGLRQTVVVKGLGDAIDTLGKLAAFIEHGDFTGLAADVLQEEAATFEANTPISDRAHPHMAQQYQVLPLPDGSIMQNLTSYAGLIVYEGAGPHDIPNSFGWGQHEGFGSQRKPPQEYWHPGFQPNPALKALWEDAPERLEREVQVALDSLLAGVFS